MHTITQTQTHLDQLDQIVFTITDDQGIASELYVEAAHGLVLRIETREDRQREGLATALYEHAATVMDIYHVPEWGRTEDGLALVDHIDGEVMDDQLAADILGVRLEDVMPDAFDY